MTSVDERFSQYTAAYRAGEDADPARFLDGLTGADRRELEALITAFLERTPREGARDALSDRVLAGLQESWATLLPEARTRAQLKRSDLVARLAAALGVSGRETKVAEYYHRMEQERIERPERIDERVFGALGDLLGVSAARLRAAGRWSPPAAPGPVFARSAPAPAAPAAAAPPREEALAEDRAPEPDEVDRLFLGG